MHAGLCNSRTFKSLLIINFVSRQDIIKTHVWERSFSMCHVAEWLRVMHGQLQISRMKGSVEGVGSEESERNY